MRMHPRTDVVDRAEIDLTQRLLEWARSYALTDTERLIVIYDVLAGNARSILKYQLREERHGDTGTPADVAAAAAEEDTGITVECGDHPPRHITVAEVLDEDKGMP